MVLYAIPRKIILLSEEVPHPLRKLDKKIERGSDGKGGQSPKDATVQGVSHS